MKPQNKKIKRKKFFIYFPIVSFILSIITLISLFLLNVLPFKYFILIIIGVLTFDIIMFTLLLSKSWKKRIFGTIFSSLKMIGLVIIIFFTFTTFDFLDKIKSSNYNTKNYSLIVLKSSNKNKLKELNNKTIGILGSDEGLNKVEEHLKDKININYEEKEDLDSLAFDLLNYNVDAILVEDANKKILEEEHDNFLSLEKVIYQFSIDIEIKDNLVKDVDIINNSFNVYISGIDSYGKISSVSRSDVNIVLTINPKTHKILFTSIPRDYYVKLNGIDTEFKDKLTHAGTHGINTSVKTVEDLLGIDINYYIKINFTSLVTLVDKLGGIEVNVSTPFRAFYDEDGVIVNYSFKKGINKLNGKQALAFARERKSLTLGDIDRVEHQQMILQGLFDKILSKNVITNYSDILNSLNGKFVTNMGSDNITNLVKYQIKNTPNWHIEKNILEGINASNYTYSYQKKKSYVMEPDIKSLDNGKNLIKSILEEN